jgi:hypothetical protein
MVSTASHASTVMIKPEAGQAEGLWSGARMALRQGSCP